MLRLSATSSLIERDDVIIVASVSCIYGLGSPEDTKQMTAFIQVADSIDRNEFLKKLIALQYTRNDVAPERGEFRVNGDTVDIFLAYQDEFLRIEFWDDEVEALSRREPLTGNFIRDLERASIFPASHFVVSNEKVETAEEAIMNELKERVAYFESKGKLVEAQRIYQRTRYDLEMMQEMGFCQGIENYSRHLTGREAGAQPYTLFDYFNQPFLTIIDESHVSVPQVRGMFNADQGRKKTLVEHGFRLPSALDNRPLNFQEFDKITQNTIYVSATPANFEFERTEPVQQIIRPTGLLDPEIEVRPLATQIDDLIAEIRETVPKKERILVTTLTKRTAEDLTDYLRDLDIRVSYIHSGISALERVDILRDLRRGEFDVIIGVNLLREGLDLPEVSLVAILDADKEGFLRSETSLVQTIGRAARNENGRVILYADRQTDSMKKTMRLTNERRQKQIDYNELHDITPTSVHRAIEESMHIYEESQAVVGKIAEDSGTEYEVVAIIGQMEKEMLEAAKSLEFERAAILRDQIKKLKEYQM